MASRLARGAAQTKAEAQAVAVPTPDAARAWLRAITEEPHVAGTPADKKTAEYVRDKLLSWGWQADLAEYEVLLNYPTHVSCDLIRPTSLKLKMTEDAVIPDKDSPAPTHSGLSRLWCLGQRVGSGRLRELRPARRLRGPRKAGRRRQREDRPGPLW